MLLALLLAAANPAAPFAPAQSPVSVEAPARPDSLALAQLLNPEGPMVEMVVRNFQDAMRSTFQANEDHEELELESPGITEAMVAAATKVMRDDIVADMPALRLRYAGFYAAHFTPAETVELIRFYSSSAGQRLVAGKYAKLDAKPLLSDFVADPDSQVSQQQIRTINSTTAKSIMSEMSAQDVSALMEFAKTPVFLKLTRIRGAFEQLEADIANTPDPALDKALDEALNAVIQKFTASPE